MRTGLAVSVIGHGVLIALGVIGLASTAPLDNDVEAVPVDLVSIDEVTSLDKGIKTETVKKDPAPNAPAEAAEQPKPDPAPPAKKPAPPPPPAPAPPQPPAPPEQAQPTPPPQPEPKQAETPPPQPAPAPPEPTPDVAKVEPPQKTAMVPPKPRLRPKPPKPAPTQVAEAQKTEFDTDKIAALLDKTPPASAPDQSQSDPGLGVPKGVVGAKMTQNELDALRAAVQACWVIPQGWTDPREVSVTIRFRLNQDGSVAGNPEIIEFPASQYGQVAADNAIRAVLRCGPYQLPPEKYDQWSEVQLRFTPMG